MSTVNARETLDRVRRIVQDEQSVRWWLPELVLWLNDGVREIALHRPQALATSITISLGVGTRQTVPADCFAFLRATHNVPDPDRLVSGLAIRMVDKEALERAEPYWHDPARTLQRAEVRHVAHDPVEPKAFYVYPGNNGLGAITAVVAKLPPPVVATGGNPDDLDAYDVAIAPLDGIYGNALVDYIIYRAMSKDAQFAGNAERALAHYQAFATALGSRARLAASENPNTVRTSP